MESQAEGVRAGFKEFVEDQRKVEGKCRLTVIQFDDHSGWNRFNGIQGLQQQIQHDCNETLVANVSINKVDPVKALERFAPRGGTPLYDATAKAIATTESTIAEMETKGKKPDHIIFVVFTDGQENASREFNFQKLTELVKSKEEKGWTFVYLGANHDAYAQGATTGISVGNTQTYAGSDIGASAAYSSLSRAVTSHRTTHLAGVTNTDFFEGTKEAEEALKDAADKAVDKVANKTS